ncbi:MAG TPA: SpoIIE family protein phosphatase [Firmicutes bacterium]|jgi:stage II sporulation protein E|nr:SpoIIE family protein phosphatase [Bacillota bacterium]HOQ24490.1 SpoIIE family protein phosphatase [Bacillota bacterium]HPT67312.1 SpoIIE family protein phosphatase [Bacillota bacterium]
MNNMLGNEVYQPREWIFANKKTAVRLRKVKDNPIPWQSRLRQTVGQDLPFAALILLLWRVPFFAGMKPFVWGFLFAWSASHPPVAGWAFLLMLPVWCFSPEALTGGMVARMAALALLNLFVLIFGPIRFRGMLVGAGLVSLATVIFRLLYHSDGLGMLLAVGEIIIGLFLGWLLLPALNKWRGQDRRFVFREIDQQLSAISLICMVFLGLTGLNWGVINLSLLFGVFVIMFAADRFGFTASIVMGSCLSLVQLVTADSQFNSLLYAAVGLFAGIGKEYAGLGVSVGTVFSLVLVALFHGSLWGGELFNLIPPALLAGVYGLLVRGFEKRLLNSGQSLAPVVEVKDRSLEERVRAVLTERLKGLAAVFDRLSQSLSLPELAVENKSLNIYGLIEEICERTCKQCTGYERCWGENFYETYRGVFDLISLAEMVGQVDPGKITGRLATECFQLYRLLSAINHRVEQQKVETLWNRRLEENRHFLSGQLQGVANIMSNLAQEVRMNVDFQSELENELKLAFIKCGLNVQGLYVVQRERDRLEIRVRKRSCGGCHECRAMAAPIVARITGQKYVVSKRECLYGDGSCSFVLGPAKRYEIRSAVCKKPRQGNLTSGDTHSLLELQDGYFVAILSDGMGVGPKAAQASGTTVTVMEELLRAGLNKEFVVQMVNSVLLLRNQEETFATVDVCLINLYSAQAEFLKIGAAPTYIKRDKEVKMLCSTSLPVGILNKVDAETSKYQLLPGDLVVMLTDGILESKPAQEPEGDWVLQTLAKVDVTGPDALGQYLLECAAGAGGGGARDDMTVVVLQVEAMDDV